jgi:putative spermidine/putrescine transport system ATP-binding protein
MMMVDGIELEVEGLTRRYSPQVTVGPISFEVRTGEFFSLLGPSGCGKTTTLRCIAGFETLNAGTIRLQGERLDDKPPHRRDVGLVFQNYALFPHLSVFDNVAFGLKLRRIARAEIVERVGQILRLVDLSTLAQRLPAQLSGGQQQRVAIARALAMEPKMMLFDEPTSALDPETEAYVISALERASRGRTTFIIAHRLSTLRRVHQLVVLEDGRMVQHGTYESLRDASGLFRRLLDAHALFETEQEGKEPAT